MHLDRGGLEALSREQCLELLARTRIGRVGFHARALPVIVPALFAVAGDDIVVRVPGGSDLDRATREAVVAFEADDVDVEAGTGWSVTVTGAARDVIEPDEVDRARALPLGDWDDDAVDRLVRISLDLVSGQRWSGAASGEDDDAPATAAGAGPAAVAETHAGIVFFVGDRAYKLKKALDLGFVDFRTRGTRLAACRQETTLNRRLAPDVYLGVADVSGPDGRPCDHLVVMRRMPDDRRLSSLVSRGAQVQDDLSRLARLLADFHRSAATSAEIDDAASRDANAERWETNAREMAPFSGEPLDSRVLDQVAGLAGRYLAGRQPLFDRRIGEGRARDGHGDLLADDIFCLDDGPRVLDCLEFDDRLRFGDVLADVAFLAMDLERLGRADLASHFLDEYRMASGDCWPGSLLDHYVAYRAQVRAKVACLRWAQGDTASADAAGRLLRMCHEHLWRARVRLVLVGGAPGTGKSTVAGGLAAPLGAVVLRSDEVRKELAGLAPVAHASARLDEDLYQPSAREATYGELLARARDFLALGRTVVVDATWGNPRWREAAASLAEETVADLVELRCVTPVDLAVDRVSRRLEGAVDPSDATAEVARELWMRDRAWTTATEVDTSGDPAAAVAAALEALDGTPTE